MNKKASDWDSPIEIAERWDKERRGDKQTKILTIAIRYEDCKRAARILRTIAKIVKRDEVSCGISTSPPFEGIQARWDTKVAGEGGGE